MSGLSAAAVCAPGLAGAGAPLPLSLTTERLLLRVPEPADAAALVDALRESYDRMWPWLDWARDLPTPEEAADRLETARRRYLAGEDFWFVLIRREDGMLLGISGLHRRPGGGARAIAATAAEPGASAAAAAGGPAETLEIGYWIRSRAEGRGYVGEAVERIVEVARRRLGARRLEIRTWRENARSVRVAERAGFRLETVLPREHRHFDGTRLDTLVFALPSRPPWRIRRR